MKILVVEDEPKVASFIKRGLEESDYEVAIASDGMSGSKIALEENFNLIILDLNLPIMHGFEVCKKIRAIKEVPILMLTAFSTIDDKLAGFESGADDFLQKPFEFLELLARIKVLLKRNANANNDILLRVADLELDVNSKRVTRGAKQIELTAKEFYLLEYLLKNKGKVLSRAQIAEDVWDLSFDTGTNIIDVYVNYLRKKIDKDFKVKLIHTQIGMGYVLREATE